MTRPLRIGYFGLPLGALLLAADGHELAWTVLSPVAQPGRRRLSRRLPDVPSLDLLEEGVGASWQTAVDELLRARPVELIVSWFFTRRILGPWIASAPQGAIGAHPSLLPKYRGPDPFYAVIDAGETTTGVTVHRLTAEYDDGAILMQRTLEVGSRNAWQLARALDRPSLGTLREVSRAFAEGRPPRGQDQDQALVTLAPAPTGEGLRVDWTWPTCRVMRRIRALCPIPGLALELAGLPFIVVEARPCDDYPRALAPGEAFLGERLVLRTGDGAISVERAALELEDADEPVTVSGPKLRRLIAQTTEKLKLI
jgi:methionyl-tRNA formyltransferase